MAKITELTLLDYVLAATFTLVFMKIAGVVQMTWLKAISPLIVFIAIIGVLVIVTIIASIVILAFRKIKRSIIRNQEAE